MQFNAVKNKAKKLPDLVKALQFFFKAPPFNFEEKEISILETDGYKNNLQLFVNKAQNIEGTVNHDTVSEIVSELCEETGLKFKDFGMPLRVALTGTTQAPGVGDIVEIFGKDESIKRIQSVL